MINSRFTGAIEVHAELVLGDLLGDLEGQERGLGGIQEVVIILPVFYFNIVSELNDEFNRD